MKVRRLMRDYLVRPIPVGNLSELLDCSTVTAKRVLAHLEREGFVERVNGVVKPSLKGSALAQARASKPLHRSTAERLVSEVVQRAKIVNATDILAYRVKTMVVFGSFLNRADRLNDVDIACGLVPRWKGEDQEEAEQFSRLLHEGRFRNSSESFAWPKLEVLQYLKSRSRGLSVQELNQWILDENKHIVVFSEEE
jgi:hypothetical protein